MLDPEEENVAKRVPQRLPFSRFEIHRVDVLVLLWRVLGVFDGTVGPVSEPLGMLANPGMIRGCLNRDVECDIESQPIGETDKPVEIVNGAEAWLDCGMPAGCGADGPRAARIPGRCREGVVAPFAMRLADRMDGRQIDDIEAHGRDIREPCLRLAKRAAS